MNLKFQNTPEENLFMTNMFISCEQTSDELVPLAVVVCLIVIRNPVAPTVWSSFVRETSRKCLSVLTHLHLQVFVFCRNTSESSARKVGEQQQMRWS